MRRTALVAAVMAAMLAVGAMLARADFIPTSTGLLPFRDREPTHQGARDRKDFFSGFVTARGRCHRHRHVVLYRKRRSGPIALDTGFTNAQGQWKIKHEDPPDGRYYAHVTRTHRGADTCGGADSNTISVHNH